MTPDNTLLAQQLYLSQKKDSTLYIVLALLLGGLGLHHFYLGKTLPGVLFLLFCWTLVPSIIALVQCFSAKQSVAAYNLALAQRIPAATSTDPGALMNLAMI